MTIELVLLPRVAYRGREITSARLGGLLALLADDLRTGCGTGRLIEGIWPEDRPEHPAKALQVLVSRARAQLGPSVVEATPAGYRLALAEDQVDASAVLLSAAACARLSRAGDHEAALAHAETGLALGNPRADTGSDDPLAALRAARASTRRWLVRARALCHSRLGRPAEALDTLAGLAADRPRDEELLVELLRSEAAITGPSAALARYDSYRRDTLAAITVNVDDADTRELRRRWEQRGMKLPLKVIESPYREITRPVVQYVKNLRRASPRDVVCVYIPEYVAGRWWENILHNQSSLRLKGRLLFEPGIMVTSVPWQLRSTSRRDLQRVRPLPGDLRRGVTTQRQPSR